ncbi:MAG: VacJ family lipoprotein [Halioglobus sp.]
MIRLLAAFTLSTLLCACASGPPTTTNSQPALTQQNYPEPVFSAERILPEDYDLAAVYDPWQGMNRRIYNFNYRFDQAVFLPVVNTWEAVVPGIIRKGVHNFYRTIADVNTMINSVLQLSPGKFFDSTGRVFVNSTFGLLGLIDVASEIGIPRHEEDFGQTLGRWGVGRGPYVVLPLLGPSNLRDSLGLIPDFAVESIAQQPIFPDSVRPVSTVLEAVDTRADTSFRYYETGFTFEYRMMRWLYSTKRDLDVLK